jgi:hypothetical protein
MVTEKRSRHGKTLARANGKTILTSETRNGFQSYDSLWKKYKKILKYETDSARGKEQSYKDVTHIELC